MPIGILFSFAGQIIDVTINGSVVLFRTSQQNRYGTIDNIKLDKKGTIKEFPDLENDEDWQNKARERFKEKMINMKTERERAEYVLDDLKKFGYKPLAWQQSGFRVINLA
jgi:protein tyrosine/serine phosphatase